MSYCRKIEYEMIPKESFFVIRGCPKCGKKTYFKNTEKFRLNANGNKLDVWLIYQCEECKHTLNLTIYGRQKAPTIPKDEYQRFLDNDETLARRYGRDVRLFAKNKAEIALDRVSVAFVKKYDVEDDGYDGLGKRIVTIITNPCQMKIRPEKQIAMLFNLSRSEVKRMLEQGKMEIKTELPQEISFLVNDAEGGVGFSEMD